TARNIIEGLASAVAGIRVECRRSQDRNFCGDGDNSLAWCEVYRCASKYEQCRFRSELGRYARERKVMHPTAVQVLLTDRILGNTLELHYCGLQGIMGRLDDYTVALQAGATYVGKTSAGPVSDLGAVRWSGSYDKERRYGRRRVTELLE